MTHMTFHLSKCMQTQTISRPASSTMRRERRGRWAHGIRAPWLFRWVGQQSTLFKDISVKDQEPDCLWFWLFELPCSIFGLRLGHSHLQQELFRPLAVRYLSPRRAWGLQELLQISLLPGTPLFPYISVEAPTFFAANSCCYFSSSFFSWFGPSCTGFPTDRGHKEAVFCYLVSHLFPRRALVEEREKKSHSLISSSSPRRADTSSPSPDQKWCLSFSSLVNVKFAVRCPSSTFDL